MDRNRADILRQRQAVMQKAGRAKHLRLSFLFACVPLLASCSLFNSAKSADVSTVTPTPIGGGSGQIAFAGPDGVYVMHIDGTGRMRLPDSIGNYMRPLAWSPDGSRLAYTCAQGICVTDFNGPPQVCPDQGFGLAWSPDGQRIAFQAVEPFLELRVMGANCQVSRRLVKEGYDPVWSPDGDQIAFSDVLHRLQVVNADGTGLILVAAAADGPAWSPDGEHIAFASYAHKGILVVNADGTGQAPLAIREPGAMYLLQPIWSPDGTEIAYASAWANRAGPHRLDNWLYLMNADGTADKRLARILGRRFAWSPDGNEIAFSAEHPTRSGIFLVNTQGAARIRPLTDNGEDYPAWRP